MLAYLSVLFLLWTLAFLYKETRSFAPLFLIFLVLVLFGGLRNFSVGTDTFNYVHSFQSSSIMGESFFSFNKSFEPGYQMLEKLVVLVSREYWVLLSSIMVLSITPYLYSITKLSHSFHISIFLFFVLGAYLFVFNGGRQGLAAGLFSIGFVHLINRNFYKYLLWVGIASTFHLTALMMLPVYFLFGKKITVFNVVLCTGLAVAAVFFSGNLMQNLEVIGFERYAVYKNRGFSGGELTLLFYLVSFAILVFLKKQVNENMRGIYVLLLFMQYLNLVIYIIVIAANLDVNLLRMSIYFSMASILIWPIALLSLQNTRSSIVINLIFYAMHFVFFYFYLTRMSNLIPYVVNTEIL